MTYFGMNIGHIDGRSALSRHLSGKHTKYCTYYSTAQLGTVCSITNSMRVSDSARLRFESMPTTQEGER